MNALYRAHLYKAPFPGNDQLLNLGRPLEDRVGISEPPNSPGHFFLNWGDPTMEFDPI
jgi:hypothetical protein